LFIGVDDGEESFSQNDVVLQICQYMEGFYDLAIPLDLSFCIGFGSLVRRFHEFIDDGIDLSRSSSNLYFSTPFNNSIARYVHSPAR
jgi:hypothetical protein